LIYTLHEAHAAHVADHWILFLKRVQSVAQPVAHDAGVLDQIVFFDHFDGRAGRSACDRIAAERRDRVAFHAVGNLWRSDGCADGNTVGHSFRKSHDIGLDVPVLDAKHFATGAPPPGLYFVGNKQAAVFSNDADDLFEIFLGRNDEAADALDRLGEKGGNPTLGGHG